MTDNEIIKAMEHCYGKAAIVGCSGCPLKANGACLMILEKESVELVKRQKAEIERLKRYDEERDIALHARLTEKARAEAIRDFAESIKEKVNIDLSCGADSAEYLEYTLFEAMNNLVKEMTEQ